MKSLRWVGAAIALVVLSLLTSMSSSGESQNGFALMDGEIRVRGVLSRTEADPPKWLLRLEKPIDVDGKETNVIEVMEPSPGPVAPLTTGSRYEFTGRLNTQRKPALLRVSTIRRLESPATTTRSKNAKP